MSRWVPSSATIKGMNTPTLSAQSLFWSQLFSGPTPAESLGLALKEDIVSGELLDLHGGEWLEAWISGLAERMEASRDLTHRPWRRAQGVGSYSQRQLLPNEMAPRLEEMDLEHPDAGILSVLEGFHRRGVSPFGKLKTLKHLGEDALAACVALNLPAGIDLLGSLSGAPSPADLDRRQTPHPVHKERIALPWLHAAALGWQDTLLQALLDYGLDPNIRDRKGQTALFHARTPTAVKALLKAGADPSAKDNIQNTAPMAWGVAREESFVANISLEALRKTMGEAGASEGLDNSKAVLYVAAPPTHPEGVKRWIESFPKTSGELHEARMDPGGAWRGSWSPAGWLGLQTLRGEIWPHTSHVPYLLGREDFLSPVDYSPRGKLTERGLLGLALASLADEKTFRDNSTQEIRQAVWARFGKDWFWSDEWQPAILATSTSLVSLKSTPMGVREHVEKAWLGELYRVEDRAERTARAWELRAHGAVRFESTEWSHMIVEAPASALPFFALACLGDVMEKQRRENGSDLGSLYSLVSYGAGNIAWKALEDHFSKGGGFDLEACPTSLRPFVESTIEQLSSSDLDLSRVTPLLEARMEREIPQATARCPKGKGRL